MLSRAPEIKRTIYTELVTALDGDGTVTVHLGTPTPETSPYEYVIVGPEDTPMTVRQEMRGFGPSRTEQIDVPILIEVFKAGNGQEDAEDRSWEIASVIGDLLASRPFDGMVFAELPSEITQVTKTFAEGRQSAITLTVNCTAKTLGI